MSAAEPEADGKYEPPADPGCCNEPETVPRWDFGQIDDGKWDELDVIPSQDRFKAGWYCENCGAVGDREVA